MSYRKLEKLNTEKYVEMIVPKAKIIYWCLSRNRTKLMYGFTSIVWKDIYERFNNMTHYIFHFTKRNPVTNHTIYTQDVKVVFY